MELDPNAFMVWVRSWGAAAAVANAKHEGHSVDEIRAAATVATTRAMNEHSAVLDAIKAEVERG